jgi:hypothetical protein
MDTQRLLLLGLIGFTTIMLCFWAALPALRLLETQ